MEGGTGFPSVFLRYHWPHGRWPHALVLSLGNVAALEADKASSCWSKCSGTPSKAVHYTTLMLLGEIREREERRGQA